MSTGLKAEVDRLGSGSDYTAFLDHGGSSTPGTSATRPPAGLEARAAPLLASGKADSRGGKRRLRWINLALKWQDAITDGDAATAERYRDLVLDSLERATRLASRDGDRRLGY